MGGPKNPKQPILSLIWDQMYSVPVGCFPTSEMRLQLQLRLPKYTGSFSCRVLFNLCARCHLYDNAVILMVLLCPFRTADARAHAAAAAVAANAAAGTSLVGLGGRRSGAAEVNLHENGWRNVKEAALLGLP